jgi:hypothetical protein
MPGSAITPGTITITQLESNVATVVSTGGGPKITNIQVTDNAYTALDDTAVDITGGYITITGTGFVTGCSVIVGQLPAASVTFISSTEVRAQLSAQSAGTYIVYLVNPDGGVGIRVNGVTHSASPAWQTASGLPDQYDGVAINLSLVATDATSYTITSGSLPPGLSLNSNTGVISGTVSGVANDTLYTFTVRATDAQLQDSPRTFTVTITVSDAYFKLTTLLLSASAVSANTVIRDSSTNNFNLTVSGDARASNFTPYGTGWSAYFDGTGDYLTVPYNAAFSIPGDFTIEFWMYATNFPASIGTAAQSYARLFSFGTYNAANSFGLEVNSNDSGNLRKLLSWFNGTAYSLSGNNAVVPNIWYHIAVVRNGTTITCYLNGSITGTIASASATINTSQDFYIASLHAFTSDTSACFAGYLSNFRIIKGTALYTANFTPATTNLTSVANTSLLTCHANRFLDGSTNNFAITRNGDARVVSFNPFNITNTGVNGSMYFDGSGDYVTVPSSASLGIGASDYTVEGWFYTTDVSALRCVVTYGSGTFRIFFNASNIWFLDGGTSLFQPTGVIVPYLWNHMAIVRSGSGTNNTACFLNGTRIAQVTNTANFSTAALTIGAEGAGSYYIGYMSNLRIVKGTALYDPSLTTYTVPTSPLTAIANTQLLTLQYDQPHNNHTFLDSSSNQFVVTRNGNATQGTFSPFSPAGWSVYFIDTSSHNISAVTGAETSPGTGDFCAELWYWTSKSGNQALIGNLESNTETQWVFTLITGGVIRIQGWNNTYVSGTSGPLNSWNHVAVCRSGTTMSIFVNGSRVGTATVTNNFSGTSNIRVGGPNGVDYFLGYISNARFVKGSSVYDPTQVSITVPTGPLTAITNTKFLVCQGNRLRDISSNNFTLTTSGSPQIQAFSPFAPTAVYSPVTHGGSAYFDGTGDSLAISSTNAFTYGTAAFTIEAWVYSTGPGATRRIYHQMNTGSNQVTLLQTSANKINAFINLSGVAFCDILSVNNLQAYAWNHVAFVRSGNNFALFINGIREGTASSASSAPDTGATVYIGTLDSSEFWLGYISNLRAIKGVAVYDPTQTTVPVPTAPVTATTNTSLLLNFTDAAILDSTGRQVFETVADAKSSGVVTKFTGGSISFDGTGDALRFIQSPYWNITSTTTHTIEAWVYHTGTTAKTICSNYWYQDGSSEYGWMFQILNTSSVLRFASAAASSVVASTTAVPTGVWAHVAATIVNLNVTFYINGVNAGGGGTVSSINYTNTIPSVGAAYSNGGFNSGPFVGYINDLRITQGHARYTANFTAPTGPARLK